MAVVLVVDDEIGIANLLTDVLTDEGYRVVVAVNGRDALERAEAERPDLVISDFMMPVMDGASLVKAMSSHPQLRDIPIVLMSSVPEATIKESCTGYALYVRKPFDLYNLMDVVSQFLEPPEIG